MKNNDFPFPLDTPIEETIPVRKVAVEVDDNTGQVKTKIKTVMETQTTTYINAPILKYRCKPGDHRFRVINLDKSIFGCVDCQYARKVYPFKYRYDEKTMKLINKYTGEVL